MRFFRTCALVLTPALLAGSSPTLLNVPARAQETVVARPVPVELQSYVERFTGAEPTDCGRHLLARPFVPAAEADLQRSVTCALNAMKNRKPFSAFKQDRGIDSLVFRGLLGTSEGTAFLFSYDSAPCGGPGCPGRFLVELCERPTVISDRGIGPGSSSTWPETS